MTPTVVRLLADAVVATAAGTRVGPALGRGHPGESCRTWRPFRPSGLRTAATAQRAAIWLPFAGSSSADGEVRLELRESAGEAGGWASRLPGRCSIGAHGWALVNVGPGEGVPRDVRERWIDESYVLLAPKALAALRPADDRPAGPAIWPPTKPFTKRPARSRSRKR